LGEELLAPHRCYRKVVKPLLAEHLLRGLVHVTGGGITDNTPRILPKGTRAVVRLGTWPVLPIFNLIARRGRVPKSDMLRTFNMGIGMMLIVARRNLTRVTTLLAQQREKFWIIGEIQRGNQSVKYIGDF
jgi:phosphoribosylformylglycinamidine cyclo-ligase